MITTEIPARPAPAIPAAVPVRLLPVAPGRWRVLDRLGRALGHLEARDVDGAVRYRARRFHAPSRMFRDLGEFWSAVEAIACLRSR